MKIFESFALEAPKTKILASALATVLNMKKKAKRYDVLLVDAVTNKNLFRASANLQKTKAIDAASLNVIDVLDHKSLFLEKDAVATIAKHYKIGN